MSKENIVESLFNSIDIIVSKRLDEVSYDKTIICTVTDDSNKKNGEYRVSDGSITFLAYSENTSYKKKDQVRVQIPQGDYSQQKYIMGKSANNNVNTPLTFISPFESVVNVTNNLISESESKREYGIKANDNKSSIILWNTGITNEFEQLQANQVYTTIGLKGSFKTRLDNRNTIAGNYGLQLDLLVRPQYAETGYIKETIRLDAKEMIGNPYNFIIYTSQEKVFDITGKQGILGVELSLYQDNNFINRQNELIPVRNDYDDILVTDLELFFGSDLNVVTDNTVTIYTTGDLNYSITSDPSNLNKELGIMWYNKDDNNQYIGFSDGIYDTSYDEREYLKLAEGNYRLENQMGREGVPQDKDGLELAATLDEESTNLTKISKIIGQDLYNTFMKFESLMAGAPDEIQLDWKNFQTSCGDVANLITTNLTNTQKVYKTIFYYAWLKDKEPTTEWKNDFEGLSNKNYLISSEDDINTLTKINTLLNSTLNELGRIGVDIISNHSGYSAYKSIFDTYDDKLTKLIQQVNTISPRVNNFYNGNYFNLLQNYINGSKSYPLTKYEKPSLEGYDNRYSIYWYRYDKEKLTEKNKDFLPAGWVEIESAKNIGLPPVDNEGVYHQLKCTQGENAFIYSMNPELQEEKFKAVLFFNHTMYVSNELIFTNQDEIIDEDAINKKNAIGFEHRDASQTHYPAYSLDNSLTNAADGIKARTIRCHYYNMSGVVEDTRLAAARIYWYIPCNSTMLDVDNSLLLEKGFSTDYGLINIKNLKVGQYIDEQTKNTLETTGGTVSSIENNDTTWKIETLPDQDSIVLPEYSKVGYYCYYKIWEKEEDQDFIYKIKKVFDQSATQNIIICQIYFENNSTPVQGEELFTFSISGTSGTKYTFSITPATSQSATTETQSLPLNISLLDNNNNIINITDLDCSWIGQNNPSGSESLKEEDGIAKQLVDGNISGLVISQNKYGILQASVQQEISFVNAKGEEELKNIRLTNMYSTAWTKNLDYYISGPTSIVYNNMGTIDNSSYLNTPYQLFSKETNQLIENIVWDIEYRKVNVNKEFKVLDTTGDSPTEEEFYNKYMPSLSEDNYLIPASMYLSNLDCYAIICAYEGEIIPENLVWKQPLIITQNRYPSTLLNEWDGSFSIDEENGIIMSTMLVAGKKELNNTFSGVLMGDVGIGTEGDLGFHSSPGMNNQTGLGLYGFHEGEQSYCFNVDGSAFLGKAGRGRIIFDGNVGAIASANWFKSGGTFDNNGNIASQSSDGMCINLMNGHIDAFNFKLTSSTIYLDSAASGRPNGTSGNYYMYIGEPNGSFISFNSEGGLAIAVSSLAISSKADSKTVFDGTFEQALNNYLDSGGYVTNNSLFDWWKGEQGNYLSVSDFNHQNVFDKLTDGGKIQGIWINNNNLYVNASNIRTGILSSSNFVDTDDDGIPEQGTAWYMDTGLLSSANCALYLEKSMYEHYNRFYHSYYGIFPFTAIDARICLQHAAGFISYDEFIRLAYDSISSSTKKKAWFEAVKSNLPFSYSGLSNDQKAQIFDLYNVTGDRFIGVADARMMLQLGANKIDETYITQKMNEKLRLTFNDKYFSISQTTGKGENNLLLVSPDGPYIYKPVLDNPTFAAFPNETDETSLDKYLQNQITFSVDTMPLDLTGDGSQEVGLHGNGSDSMLDDVEVETYISPLHLFVKFTGTKPSGFPSDKYYKSWAWILAHVEQIPKIMDKLGISMT